MHHPCTERGGPPDLENAACRQAPAALQQTFLTADNHDTADVQHAKEYCTSCPVNRQCLLLSYIHNGTPGIWGGLTTSERTELSFADALARQ